MERTVFRWLTGAGAIAAAITFAVDTWGAEGRSVASEVATPTPATTMLVVVRNGAKLVPYAVCPVAQVGE
jgi:hypothetical protein